MLNDRFQYYLKMKTSTLSNQLIAVNLNDTAFETGVTTSSNKDTANSNDFKDFIF